MKNNDSLIRYHFPSVSSTNTWAKEHIALLSQEKTTLITADEQTAGRGTFNRKWVSPSKKNIYATFCLLWKGDFSLVQNIPQLMALATIQVMENQDIKGQLKWPNDVLIGEKKVAGILTETKPHSNGTMLILGIGFNVNATEEDLKQVVEPKHLPTSLYIETGKTFELEELLSQLSELFVDYLTQFAQSGCSFLIEKESYLNWTMKR